jgi:hypothetical protein
LPFFLNIQELSHA